MSTPRRDRRAALRAVQAAAEDATGKLGVDQQPPLVATADPEPPTANGHGNGQAVTPHGEPAEVSPPAPREPQPDAPAREAKAKPARPKASPAGSEAEALLPEAWRERIAAATEAESVELHGERVRRRVEETTVYLATRVPRSLRDAVRQRSERLDVSMQEFVVRACEMMLAATARAADPD